MELEVLKIDGTQSGKKVTLDEKVFGVTPNDHAIYLDVVQFLANQRHGNAKTKDPSEIAYSTKKLGRQKGGGGARHGSRKANIFVGGGRVFGPVPRFYHNKLNKKVKRLARHSALSYKAQENAIILLEPFKMEAPKTKELLGIVKAVKAGDRK
ncbi:MAG: 50S ribosomal protein L4, partial [Bacteroidales bacterium]|nr:50S ribosomal protein L4 [Bacteroidales bacterium]